VGVLAETADDLRAAFEQLRNTVAGPLITGAVVSVLAAVAALIQPWAGRARDSGRLHDRVGMTGGLLVAGAGFALAATVPGLAGLLAAAAFVGVGVGVVTPLAFSALAAGAPPERLGQTMGAAEVGRELGDAGGPLFVGALAATASLSLGLIGLATALTAAAVVVVATTAND
jgi:DHA1 family tetracycline resistance protein-like MFS transporter